MIMEWYRNIKRYVSGDDVLYAKQKLVELGYLYAATKKRFGDDSYRAVKAFQAANGLPIDGVIGQKTWAALFGDPKPVPPVEVPDWIAEPARTEIAQALSATSAKRKEICLMALKYCVDRNKNPSRLKGFYIRGANLADKDLSIHVMTESRLNSYFKRSSYAPYYDNGRKEMMLRQARESGYTIVGADCSGMIVGLWKAARVVGTGFDATADNLYGSYCVPRAASALQPGDLAWKSGHIGLVVCGPSASSCGGWIVESGGGAYGFQLSQRTKRRLLDFRDRSVHSPGGWKKYGDPKVY